MRLQDKVAIVTGGTRGIGFAVTSAFLKEGAKVAVLGSRIETAQKAYDKLIAMYPNSEILPLGVDITNTESVNNAVEIVFNKFGKIDILVNNAGITTAKALIEMSDEDFESVMRINTNAPFKFSRAVAKHMIKEGKGSIINTSSLVGTYGGRLQSAYSTSKFAVNGLTKSLAKELGQYNIRVNAVAPGVVATDMTAAAVSEQMLAALNRMIPLGHPADPAELAGAYVYLASEDASYTTGTIIAVDGGIVMQL